MHARRFSCLCEPLEVRSLYADDAETDPNPKLSVDTPRGNAGNDLLVSKDSQVDDLFGDGGHDSCVADASDVLISVEEPG